MTCKHNWPGGCWYCLMWCAIWHDFWCQVAIVALLQGFERHHSKLYLAAIFGDLGRRWHV